MKRRKWLVDPEKNDAYHPQMVGMLGTHEWRASLVHVLETHPGDVVLTKRQVDDLIYEINYGDPRDAIEMINKAKERAE